jgi:hypothetical protein
MSSNTLKTAPHITELRQILMGTLVDLRDRENPMDIKRAEAVAQVASVLVDTANVENTYLKITGQDRSQFLEQPVGTDTAITHTASPFPGVTGITQHRLRG